MTKRTWETGARGGATGNDQRSQRPGARGDEVRKAIEIKDAKLMASDKFNMMGLNRYIKARLQCKRKPGAELISSQHSKKRNDVVTTRGKKSSFWDQSAVSKVHDSSNDL